MIINKNMHSTKNKISTVTQTKVKEKMHLEESNSASDSFNGLFKMVKS